MRDRIDPLIEERAPWIYRKGPIIRAVRGLLHLGLSYDRTVTLAEIYRDWTTHQLMDDLAQRLAREVEIQGLTNVPRHGPAMIVANHPTGIMDGIVLWHVIRPIRPDLYVYANRDILRVMPQMADFIAPVEWRKDQRSHGKTRETMAFSRQAVKDGRIGIMFPSGRLAKRQGLSLHERQWMPSAAMLARKYELPVIPINIRARNSSLFYLFDLIHPTLRDITLFHETLNKARQPYRVTIGEEISPAALPASGEEAIEMLKRITLKLGGESEGPAVSLVRATRPVLRS